MNKEKIKKIVTIVVCAVLIPSVVIVGALFLDKSYAWIAVAVAVLSCVPLFLHFEKGNSTPRELVLLAVLVALTALSRFAFAWAQGFKPVTALAIIVGVYLGAESGFVVGSLSAVVSNFYFGQGPWTPFQMFAFGLIGLIAGLLRKPFLKRKWTLYVYGALSGILFSLVMDVYTTLWADNTFNLSRYLANVVTALPVTALYVASNVVFLLLLETPVGRMLGRLCKKYGMFGGARKAAPEPAAANTETGK